MRVCVFGGLCFLLKTSLSTIYLERIYYYYICMYMYILLCLYLLFFNKFNKKKIEHIMYQYCLSSTEWAHWNFQMTVFFSSIKQNLIRKLDLLIERIEKHFCCCVTFLCVVFFWFFFYLFCYSILWLTVWVTNFVSVIWENKEETTFTKQYSFGNPSKTCQNISW